MAAKKKSAAKKTTKKSSSKKSTKKTTAERSQRKSLDIKPPEKPRKQPKLPSTALAGIILGGLSLLFIWVPFLGFVLAVLGLTFGILGIRDSKDHPNGKGLGIASVVLSGIVIIIQLFVLLAFSLFLSIAGVQDSFDGGCSINKTDIICNNVSLDDGLFFDLNMKMDEKGDLVSMDFNTSGR